MGWEEFTNEMLKIAYECFGLGILIGIGIEATFVHILNRSVNKNERHV